MDLKASISWIQLLQAFWFLGSFATAILTILQARRVAKVQFLYNLQKDWQTHHSSLAREFIGNGIFASLD